MSFAPLFPDADYRHHLSVKRGDLARFFAPREEHAEVIAERRRWLAEDAPFHAAALDSAEPIIREAARVLQIPLSSGDDASEAILELGRAVEPDVILLEKNDDGIFRVAAGCVCFPSSWSFPEKLGQPLDFIHTIVPDLNAAIGPPIARFLSKLQPGAAWERSNWGLSASPERNQHPVRNTPRLVPPVALDRTWLRVEDQILAILPETRALLFGIRIVATPLSELQQQEPAAAVGLRRALATLSDDMARYKNISAVRSDLVDLLSAS